MSRHIEALCEDQRLQLDPESVRSCLDILQKKGAFPIPEGDLEVAFVNPDTCSRLHEDFFGDPSITDVMTFPGEASDGHAGNIAICPQVALEQGKEYKTPFHEELTLYLVHGWLHLAGLRDDSPQAARDMRDAERQLMRLLAGEGGLLAAGWDPEADLA